MGAEKKGGRRKKVRRKNGQRMRGIVSGIAGGGRRRRSGDEENLQDVGDAERVLSGTKKWLFLLECARCTCTFSRKTDGRGAGSTRGTEGRQQGERSELTGRDAEGDGDDQTGGGGGRGGCGGRSGGGGRGGGNIEISNG